MNRWGIPAWLEDEVRHRDKTCIYCGIPMVEKRNPGGSRKCVATWEHIINLLLRSGNRFLTTVMRRLLTGYAIGLNRRHRRSGPLFQNRYKPILCQEDNYLLALVRYIHLNPLRAGLAADLPKLDR